MSPQHPLCLLLLLGLSVLASPGVRACKEVCDLRACPEVPAAECAGTIVKDACECCPVCQPPQPEYEFYDEDVEDGMMTPSYVNASHKELCAQITCTRLQTCTVNIQGIPMCRCPSAIFCRRQRGRRQQRPQGGGGLSGGPVCAMDGRTYRSRCFLRMKECTENKRIKVQHDGACLKRKGSGGGGGKRRERYEGDEDDDDDADFIKRNNGLVRNRKDARRENRKQQRRTEKLLQRQLRQEEKKEKRRDEHKSIKKQERREKKKAKKEDDVGLGRFEKKRDDGKKKRRERRRLRRRIASAKNKRGKKSRGRRSCDGSDLGHDTIDTIVI